MPIFIHTMMLKAVFPCFIAVTVNEEGRIDEAMMKKDKIKACKSVPVIIPKGMT